MDSRKQAVNDIGAKDVVLDTHPGRRSMAMKEKFAN